ncbi:MAG: hypothetical protein R3E84_12560 [Pseudomonadales bacterium]
MTNRHLKGCARLAMALTLLTAISASAAERRYFIVGDSYSDTGNFEALYRPNTAGPSVDGDTNWVDVLFAGHDIQPAWIALNASEPPKDGRVINFAVARATTGYQLTWRTGGWLLPDYAPNGMQWQFERMHRRYTFNPEDTLLIWGSVNDLVWGASTAPASAPARFIEEVRTPLPLGGMAPLVEQTATNLMILVERGVKFGFGRILLLSTGGDTLSPLLDADARTAYTRAADSLESTLRERIDAAAARYPQTRIELIDLSTGIHDGIREFGLRDDIACNQDGQTCETPERYLRQDFVHPTAIGYCLVARTVHPFLEDNTLPEPRCDR